MKPDGNLIVSVKEARELLGDLSDKMSDEEIERTIILLADISRASIKQSVERLKNTDKVVENP